jgi:hypothetical protein
MVTAQAFPSLAAAALDDGYDEEKRDRIRHSREQKQINIETVLRDYIYLPAKLTWSG